MKIKPIETIYKGYKFRSRLEARWAVFFDALGIEWTYENEGYDLNEFGWYLPDFEIKTATFGKWFVEVKGNRNDIKGIKKANTLDDYAPDGFMGCRIFGELEFINEETEEWCDDMKQMLPHSDDSYIRAHLLSVTPADYNRSVSVARQARFEFGETP